MKTNVSARVYLSREGGVSGPRGTIQTTHATAARDAIEWAEGQFGPWDCILVNVEGGDTHQIEYRDGSWEVV